MKRFNLMTVRALLSNIEKSNNHQATFSELAFSTPALRNRSAMLDYLNFLDELGWLYKEKHVEAPAGFARRPRHGRVVAFYRLSENGKDFLKLFPQ